MATTTTNFGWDIPQSTDLVKDGATAIAALGQDIDTALVDLKGGTTGQVLAKATNTDLDFSWVAQDDSNAIQNAIVDAKGDLISATAADTPARLAVGANGTVLTADSAEATGLKWATASGGGLVLINTTSFTTSSAVNIDSVFSSTYTNYKIVTRYNMSANTDVTIRVRSGGTTDSSSLYYTNGTIGIGTGISNAATAAQTRWYVGTGGVSSGGLSLDIYAPNTGGYIQFNSQSSALTAGSYASHYSIGGFLDKTFTADGFAIVPITGTITGTVMVYGYAK